MSKITFAACVLVAAGAYVSLGAFPERGLCAHGGDQHDYPEDTIEGVRTAIEKGAAMVEFDVQRCKSGEFICMHDGDLATTTTVTGNTWQSTFEHIRSGTIDPKKWPKFGHVKVPTFDEMIDALPREGVLLNVHCYGDAHIGRDLAIKIREKGRLHQAFIACSLAGIREARQAVPEIRACNMTRPGPANREWTDEENWEYLRATIENKCQYLQIRRRWSPKFSAWAHMAGVKVNYCPTDCEGSDPEKLAEILATGVDYVFTENLSAVQKKFDDLQAAGSRSKLTLAERNKEPAYEIVVPQETTKSVENAARHLRDYILKQTGVKLRVRHDSAGDLPEKAILLGFTRFTKEVLGEDVPESVLGTDGFRIVNRAPHLLILGSGVRGALHGAYEALERFGGVRWFASDCTKLPRLKRFEVPADFDDTQIPFFEVREPSWCDVRWNADFASHLRQNGPLSGYTGECESPQPKHGGPACPFSRKYGICHTFWRLLDPKEYFDAHPEYFSEVEGLRRKDYTQLCLTNPDVLRIVTEKVIADLDAHPEAKMIGVSQNDWWNYCTCSKCKAVDDEEGAHCGTLLRFVNAVAEEVEKRHPDVLVQTLAYEYNRKPPKKTRPRKNVVVCLCSIECDFSEPFAISTRKVNRDFVKDLEAWRPLTDRLSIWDYTTNFRYSKHIMPNYRVIVPNLRFFCTCNVKHIFEESGTWHDDFAELKAYLIGKAMWNPFVDDDALIDEFLSGFYGEKAAPFVRTIVDEAQSRVWMNAKACNPIFLNDRPDIYPDDLLARFRGLWDKALSVTADPAQRRRLEWGRVIPVSMQLDRWSESCKYVWATKAPEKVPEPASAAADRDWILKLCEEEKAKGREMFFGHYGQNLKDWERLVAFKRPAKGSAVGQAGAEQMLIVSENRADLVEDGDSIGGKCVAINNKTEDVAIWLKLSHVAFDAGTDYRVRVHAKVNAVKGGKGEAFRAEVGGKSIAVNAEDAKPGYQWYEVGVLKPEEGQIVEISPGRFAKGGGYNAYDTVQVDAVEFAQVDPSEVGR